MTSNTARSARWRSSWCCCGWKVKDGGAAVAMDFAAAALLPAVSYAWTREGRLASERLSEGEGRRLRFLNSGARQHGPGAGVRMTRGVCGLARSATSMLQPDSKSVDELTNTTSKIQLKLHILPFITLKPVSDRIKQLHHMIELHEYNNIA
jgi:hypothetical protein